MFIHLLQNLQLYAFVRLLFENIFSETGTSLVYYYLFIYIFDR